METWRKHPDLWILGVLVAGLFTFQHGDRVLAAVGPRFAVISNNVTSRLAAFTAAPSAEPAEDRAVPPESGTPEANNLRAAPRDNRNVTFVPAARQVPDRVFLRRTPQVVLRPICPEPFDHGCGW